MKQIWICTTIGAVFLAFLALPLVVFGADTHTGLTEPTFQLDADTCWVVLPEEPGALQRALHGVEQDWYKVFGRLPTVLKGPPEHKNWEGPLVYLGLKAPLLKRLIEEKFAGKESFALQMHSDTAQRNMIWATCADIYGARDPVYGY